MTLVLSPAHADARAAAARDPANLASLALLNTGAARIDCYTTPPPEPGGPPGGDPVVSFALATPAGTYDPSEHEIILTTPVLAQNTAGGVPLWARIVVTVGSDEQWWADATASGLGGGGDIEIDYFGSDQLYAGAYSRLTSARFPG